MENNKVSFKQKNYILFDLDGTVTDPKIGITRSVQYALNTFGIDVADLDRLACFIGPPLFESFREFYGFDAQQVQEAIAQYRVYYAKQGIFENILYPGMVELLRTLKEQGKRIALATSKPKVYAEQVLAHFSLLPYFDVVAGSELNGERSDKLELISYAFAHCPHDGLSRCVMVGDRRFDVDGAKRAGIDSIGVLYGYGSEQELNEAGPSSIARTVEELSSLLC